MMDCFGRNYFFIFWREVKRNKGSSAILLVATLITTLSLLIFYSNEWFLLAGHGANPYHLSREWGINVSLLEITALVLISPFLGVIGLTTIWQDKNAVVFLLAPSSFLFYIVRWLFSVSLLLVLLLVSSIIYVYFMKMGLPLAQIVASRVALISIACALTSLGFCAGAIFRDMTKSLFLSYIMVFLLMGQVLILGPFFERFSRVSDIGSLIHFLMITNGYAGIAASFELDIMRRGWLYEVSPIGMYRFEYPAWYTVSIFYVCLTFVFIGIGFIGRKRILS